MDTILNITKLSKTFGGLSALNNISLDASSGQIVGIIGPNGAGKTTLFNCLTGLYYPSKGHIIFEKQPIVPDFSEKKARLIQICAGFYFLFSIVWAPLFWSILFPQTIFKLEITLTAIFLLGIRLLVIQRLKQFQIWAWGVMFVFLASDIYLSTWILMHRSQIGAFPGTHFSSQLISLAWSGLSLCFCSFFTIQLLTRDVRQLFGFRMGPDAINRLGISRTFQNIRLFLNLSVLDNVKIGAHSILKAGLATTLFRTRAFKGEETTTEKDALQYLRFVGLENRVFELAGSLAYGEQRRLEIARAMASKPRLLLLDEPAAGMNPQESVSLIDLIRKIRDKGVTILIIEHDMKVMMTLADIIYVLDHGEMITNGTPDVVRSDPRVIEAYLGGSIAHAASK